MGGAEGCFKGNTKEKWQRGSCPPELGAQVPTAAKGKPSGWVLTRVGATSSHKWEEEAEGQLGVDGGRGPEACLCSGRHIHKCHCSGNDHGPLGPWEGLQGKGSALSSSSSPALTASLRSRTAAEEHYAINSAGPAAATTVLCSQEL